MCSGGVCSESIKQNRNTNTAKEEKLILESEMLQPRKLPKNNNKQESIEATLWQAADKLRQNMDAAEYKQRRARLIFLKNISDAF